MASDNFHAVGDGVREGHVAFESWETWYRIVGDLEERPPVICLHGGPGSTHHYFAPLERLADRGRPVVVYDQIGCGGSTRPPADGLDVGVFVRELGNLRSALGIDRCFVLGTSWGGMLAMEFALTRPPGLLGLVLNSTLASAATWAHETARLRDALPPPHAEALRTKQVEDPAYVAAERVFNARHFCRVGHPIEVERMARSRGVEVYRAMWGPNEWTMAGKLAGWDVRDRLREITVPVLLTAGRHDMCTPVVLKELQEGFPEAETILFEESSHTPYLEQPDAFVRAIGDFFAEVETL